MSLAASLSLVLAVDGNYTVEQSSHSPVGDSRTCSSSVLLSFPSSGPRTRRGWALGMADSTTDLETERSLHESDEATTTDGLTAVSLLLPRILIGTWVVVAAVVFARGPHGNKDLDRAMFVAAVLATVVISIWSFRYIPKRVLPISIALLATAAVLVGIARTERPPLYFFWEGFGTSVALLAIGVSLMFWRGLRWVQASPSLKRIFTIAVCALSVIDLASVIRTVNDFVDAPSNAFVINEMLAPAAGRTPDSNFVAQYVTLYGWLLVPFRHVFGVHSLANVAVIFLSCLSIIAVFLAVLIARRALPRGYFWLAVILVVPLTCVTALHGGIVPKDQSPLDSSIGSYLQELSIRLFPAMVLSSLGLAELMRIRSGRVGRSIFALGLLGGLIAWNSQDLGLVLVVSFTVVLWGAIPWTRLAQPMLRWLAGLAVGLALYPLLALSLGRPLDLSYFALFSRTYERGFGAALVQVPGPVLVVLPFLLGSAGVGWWLLWRHRRRAPDSTTRNEYAILTLTFVGTWGSIGLIYYINRSYASGQLQTLLLPCGICLAGLISLFLEASRQDSNQSDLPSRRSFTRGRTLTLAPLTILAALPFAAILQSPNPHTVWDALAHPASEYSLASQLETVSTVRATKNYVRHQSGSLSYFGENGNYITLATGVPTTLLTDTPALSAASTVVMEDTCEYLSMHRTKWLVVSSASRFYFPGNLCNLYRPAGRIGPLSNSLMIEIGGATKRLRSP